MPDDTTVVSWLPFYHDMGLIMGVCAPLVTGCSAVLTSPLAFLSKPASWMQLMAQQPGCFSGGAELRLRARGPPDLRCRHGGPRPEPRCTAILSGAERVHYSTVRRFIDRFAPFGLKEKVHPALLRTGRGDRCTSPRRRSRTAVRTARFDLAAARRRRRPAAASAGQDGGTELVSYGPPRAYPVRIVDPETGLEQPAGSVGEIWMRGDNVALGYWHKPEQTTRVFRARINNPSEGTPAGPWLRTGDLGAMSDGELFIMGRLKDLLIVDGRNHYPEDIEATIREITGGRVAAIAVEDEATENLVAIVEVKPAPPAGLGETRGRRRGVEVAQPEGG